LSLGDTASIRRLKDACCTLSVLREQAIACGPQMPGSRTEGVSPRRTSACVACGALRPRDYPCWLAALLLPSAPDFVANLLVFRFSVMYKTTECQGDAATHGRVNGGA